MLLNNVKNIELLKKGLYSQELKHYSSLCKVYSELIKSVALDPTNITKQDIARGLEKYSTFLDAAAKGDFNFIRVYSEETLGEDMLPSAPRFSAKDVEFFKEYSYHSQKITQFKQGSELLNKVIDKDLKTGKPMLSSTALKSFEDYMRQDIKNENPDFAPNYQAKYLRLNSGSYLIDHLVKDHSPRWLGHQFFLASKNSLNTINSIDANHLPTSLQLKNNLTPAQFGAEITGVKGNIQKFFDKFRRKDKSDNEVTYDPFTDREKEYFDKKPGKIHENLYKVGQKVKAVAGSLSRAKKAAIALTLAGALLVSPIVNTYSEARDFDEATTVSAVQIDKNITPMSVNELESVIKDFETQNYENVEDFKEDGNYALDAIEQTCQTYLKEYRTPSLEDAKSILDSLDNVTSMLVEKPIEFAIQENYPDYTNIVADLYYDNTVVDPTDFNKRISEEGIKISAIDHNGNEISTKIPNIETPFGANDLFKRVISQEKGYDTKYQRMLNALTGENTINPDTGKTYTYEELAALSTEFFNTIMKDCEIARTLTVPDIVRQSDGTYKYVLQEKEATEVETQSTTSNTTVTKEYIENEDGTTSVRYVEDDDGR